MCAVTEMLVLTWMCFIWNKRADTIAYAINNLVALNRCSFLGQNGSFVQKAVKFIALSGKTTHTMAWFAVTAKNAID